MLATWICEKDLAALEGHPAGEGGPAAAALEARDHDEAVLFTEKSGDLAVQYVDWLQFQTLAQLVLHRAPGAGPGDYSGIYESVSQAMEEARARHGGNFRLTFLLPENLPSVSAVFILLAKTRFPAELAEVREGRLHTLGMAFDFSPQYVADLMAAPDQELNRRSRNRTPARAVFTDIVHAGGSVGETVRAAARAAPRNIHALIEGEGGTGKELLATAMHNRSPRRHGPFHVVRLRGLSAEAVEAGLFGQERVAPGGARARRLGALEAARGGTLFLDDVDALPLRVQALLRQALETGEVSRLGSPESRLLDVRVIGATTRSLPELVREGAFLEDLLYRLAVVWFRLPPLRERPEDLPLLIGHFLKRVNSESRLEPGNMEKTLSEGAREVFLSHSWPGNARELLGTLRRAAVWSQGETIQEEEARQALFPDVSRERAEGALNRALSDGVDLQGILGSVARHYLTRALAETGGNKTRAAKLLGFSNYQTLGNWLRKYDVEG